MYGCAPFRENSDSISPDKSLEDEAIIMPNKRIIKAGRNQRKYGKKTRTMTSALPKITP